MMTKFCNTCRFLDPSQQRCLLSGLTQTADKDYCSKYEENPEECTLCHKLIPKDYITFTEKGEALCSTCANSLLACIHCVNGDKCGFLANPDPMPKFINKTIQQNGVIIQTQIKNPEREEKFCHSCRCWIEEYGGCMKIFGIGCENFVEKP